ncbi:septum formation family protein [Nocardioides sp. SYSU D00038]|uniref:septum formation family protein n=1 Tax=Nocardioides sp. SYSU D00038 TaxID=2812554 RepID=UPI0019676A09|nr:septum formation family protein [Nocardioides sp. SYSU D00038]
MTPSRPRVPALLATVVLVLGLGACTSDDEPRESTATTPPTAAPPPPRPEPGACRRLTHEQALAPTNDAPTVPCRRPHTAQTFSIGDLRTTVDGHLVAVDSDHVQRQVATACPTRLASFLGTSREELRLSMLRAVWFTPTLEESDAGASWFRCDVVGLAGDDALVTVRGSLADALATPEGRTRYGMCATAAPGARGFRRVLCSADHAWRAISSVDLPRGRYPGVGAARAAGEEPCEDAGRRVADDALDFEWGWEWPTREQWRAGQTWGRCWAPD